MKDEPEANVVINEDEPPLNIPVKKEVVNNFSIKKPPAVHDNLQVSMGQVAAPMR